MRDYTRGSYLILQETVFSYLLFTTAKDNSFLSPWIHATVKQQLTKILKSNDLIELKNKVFKRQYSSFRGSYVKGA